VQLDGNKYHFVLSTAWKMYDIKQQILYYHCLLISLRICGS